MDGPEGIPVLQNGANFSCCHSHGNIPYFVDICLEWTDEYILVIVARRQKFAHNTFSPTSFQTLVLRFLKQFPASK